MSLTTQEIRQRILDVYAFHPCQIYVDVAAPARVMDIVPLMTETALWTVVDSPTEVGINDDFDVVVVKRVGHFEFTMKHAVCCDLPPLAGFVSPHYMFHPNASELAELMGVQWWTSVPSQLKNAQVMVFGAQDMIPHLLEVMRDPARNIKIVIVQSEQLGGHKVTTEYMEILNRAHRCLLMSKQHRNWVSHRRVQVGVPFLFRTSPTLFPRVIDIVFCGSACPERSTRMARIAQLAPDLRCEWNQWFNNDVKTKVLETSCVGINMHAYANAVLETHRINEYLANGVIPISEHGSDPLIDAQYAGAVVFVPPGADFETAVVRLAREMRDPANACQYQARVSAGRILLEQLRNEARRSLVGLCAIPRSASAFCITPMPRACRLSILVLGAANRPTDQALVTNLEQQATGKSAQVLVSSSACTVENMATTRNELVGASIGTFVTFVNMGDEIAADYVDSILQAIDKDVDVDVIVFDVMYIDGQTKTRKLVKHGIEYTHGEMPAHYTRKPNPKSVTRREIVRRCPYSGLTLNEDDEWAERASLFMHRQTRIDKVLYYHNG